MGGGRRGSAGGNQAEQQWGFTMWALHEQTSKPLSVVPTTAMALLDTYVVTVARRFPDDAGVQVCKGGFLVQRMKRGEGVETAFIFIFCGGFRRERFLLVRLALVLLLYSVLYNV